MNRIKELALVILALCLGTTPHHAQESDGVIFMKGGELTTFHIPAGLRIHIDKTQEFLFGMYLKKDGTVEKADFRHGKNYDQKNVHKIQLALNKWVFEQKQTLDDGFAVASSFSLPITLIHKTDEGFPILKADLNPSERIEVTLPASRIEKVTTNSENPLVPEFSAIKNPSIEELNKRLEESLKNEE